MMLQNYYEILGINSNSDLNEIKRAFRKEASKHHPDINPSNQAKERFELIVEAYEVLGNETNRKEYDKLLNIQTNNLPVPLETQKQEEWKKTSKKKSKKYVDTSIEDLLLLDIFLADGLIDGIVENSDSIIDSATDALDGIFDLF